MKMKESKKEPKYVEQGFYNKPFRKPRHTKAWLIYMAVKNLSSHGGNFLPTRDHTDHFHFACTKCHCMTDVLRVDFYPRYRGNGALYAIFFWLGCPDCGNTGLRKIYLQRSSYSGQECYTYEDEVFVYSKDRKPISHVKLQPVKTKDKRKK